MADSRAVVSANSNRTMSKQSSQTQQSSSSMTQSSSMTKESKTVTMSTSSVQMQQKQQNTMQMKTSTSGQSAISNVGMTQASPNGISTSTTMMSSKTKSTMKQESIQQSLMTDDKGSVNSQNLVDRNQQQAIEFEDDNNGGDGDGKVNENDFCGDLIDVNSEVMFACNPKNSGSDCAQNDMINTTNNNSSSTLTFHPDLISDLTPTILNQLNSAGKPSSMSSFVVEQVDLGVTNRPSEVLHYDLSLPPTIMECNNGSSAEEDGDENTRKKKKKAKKSESFSVVTVNYIDLKKLVEKYRVHEALSASNKPFGEVPACEKSLFAKVSVAGLRRSFCDQPTYKRHEKEIKPNELTKSGFSKFENKTVETDTVDKSAIENGKTSKPAEQPGTQICKGCGQGVFVMEMIKAEKAAWHRNCFRCTECKKTLSVDTYQSNAGLLYCKPHFKELFQPKAVLESPEEKLLQRIRKRPEVIIRENQPVELPPDVVRASIQPSSSELEELTLDVKSKFEMFEHYRQQEKEEKESRAPVVVKKSNTVLAKMSRFQNGSDTQVGISDSDLNGGAPEEVSEDDENSPPASFPRQHYDEINYNLEDVKSKWESGINEKKEEVQKRRQEEQARFRTRLCMGKNSQIKEMYQKATTESETSKENTRRNSDLEGLDLKEKRDIKEMFEKGIIRNRRESDDENEEDSQAKTPVDLELFEHGVAKQSRGIFQSIDKQLVSDGLPSPVLSGQPKKMTLKSPSGIIGVNDQRLEGEIVKSSDVIQEEIRSEDVGNKFRFFESYQERQENMPKKQFRITPPREGQVKVDSPEREIYHDPNVIRAGEPESEKLPAAQTTTKMLSLFKRLESREDEINGRQQPRPLKQFTPPRETRPQPTESEEEEEEDDDEEYESDEESKNPPGSYNTEDKFLQEVGSLARAKKLRAKFEKWESEENSRNLEESSRMRKVEQFEGHVLEEQSIEKAKNLRAIFEQPHLLEQQKPKRKEVQVKRFVDTQSNGSSMEECVVCNKRVYAMEKAEISGKIYHKTCFRCSHCKCLLRLDTFTQNQGVLFCKPHYTQLFKIKGNYDEGFGRETGKQIWAKKQQAKVAEESQEN